LPFHAEIVRAGVGDNYGRKYPWQETGLVNEKGEALCNYHSVSNDALVSKKDKVEMPNQAHSVQMYSDLLAPVTSYWPSPLGIFNLSGNAAEMTNIPGIAVGGSWRDVDVTLQSKSKYEDANCTLGFRVVFTWQAE
jgi:hypothetical protein